MARCRASSVRAAGLGWLSLLLASCIADSRGLDGRSWPSQYARIQGFVGILELDEHRYGDATSAAGTIDTEVETLPVGGVILTQPLWGRSLQLGFEAGLSLGRGDDSATIRSGGGPVTRAESDLLLGDAFLGLQANLHLTRKARLYASAGPLIEYARAKLEFETGGATTELEDSGLGRGYYARVGFEYEVWPSSFLGIFVRHVDASVDLGADLGDLQVTGTQLVVGMTELL